MTDHWSDRPTPAGQGLPAARTTASGQDPAVQGGDGQPETAGGDARSGESARWTPFGPRLTDLFGEPDLTASWPSDPDPASPAGRDPADRPDRASSRAMGQHEPVARGHVAASGSRFPDTWRAVLDRAVGGLGWPVSATAQSRRRDLISRVRAPLAAHHCRVAVLSLKGGVGKTSTTIGLGSALAWLRQDRIIAVDASPDRGTLSDRVALDTPATIRDLLCYRDRLGSYRDVRAFTSQADSGLEILGSDRDPAASVAFGADDYASVCSVIEPHYAICLTDCATGLLNSAMYGVLSRADQIVLVSNLTADCARSASATLDWLAAHARDDLAGSAIVALCTVRPGRRAAADPDDIESHFAARCGAVTRIPFDPHLAEGTVVSWERLSRGATDGYLALAALVIDRLSALATPSQSGQPAPGDGPVPQ